MPITTQTIAKGIPPRTHKPKGKAKAQAKDKAKLPGGSLKTTKTLKGRKRPAADKSESEEEDKETMDASHSESELIGKKCRKRRRVDESDAEVELIDEDVEGQEHEIEEVDDIERQSDMEEVSSKLL